jgi:hypothetical protein
VIKLSVKVINGSPGIEGATSKMSFHYFGAVGHASVYNQFRPRPPEELAKGIIKFLTEKVLPRNISV